MFKLESYITPVILNYVGKYVKNFKPEQSQVSLWGGDAAFQNLDLRLNVLNEQFDFPFSFVSGHIHELLIHVPWVKITSEPIIITINTIECILKMKDRSEKEEDPVSPRGSDSVQEPPGYMKSIVTKVVNNITINCNNVILKFVEEDIVLSVNIRFLSMQTVNDSWQPTFTDVNVNDPILRKVITIEDLTLCLDKMDSSGKIDIYQDPVVYRCSMTIRVIMNCQSTNSVHSTTTRFDMHCSKMEFSITEHQIPMLLRLMSMLVTLQSKRALINRRPSCLSEESQSDIAELDDTIGLMTPMSNNNGWGTWAWNAVASVLPVDWNDELSMNQQLNYIGHTIHCGIYIEEAVLTLKTMETIKESFSHKSMKVRYRPFLTLKLSGVVASLIQQGISVTAYRIGIGCVQLSPRGNCSCGFIEVKASAELPQYLFAGNAENNYSKDSLFDPEFSITNFDYNNDIQKRLSNEESAEEFFKNCTAFCLDFVHHTQLPEELRQDQLVTTFEYSNFHEREVTRFFIGDVSIRICSGALHRLPVITNAIENSDILNCIHHKVEPNVNELPLVTVEEYESLNEYVPMTEASIRISTLSIQFQLADHRNYSKKIRDSDGNKFLHNKLLDYPRLFFNCDYVYAKILAPMYAFRLAACASKQKVLSEKMLNQCYKKIEGTMSGFTSLLHLSKNSHTSLIMPCNLSFSMQTLIYPQYWANIESINVSREIQDWKLDNLTVTSTKAKLIVSYATLASIFWPESTGNPLLCSSLFYDTINETNPTYLELSIESINYSSVKLLGTFTRNLSIGSIRIFALNDMEQAFVLSGPENPDSPENDVSKLLSLSVKYPKNAEVQEHAVIVSIKVAQTRASLDPLLFNWLQYRSIYYEVNPSTVSFDNHGTQETSSDTSSRKKTFPSLHENVHSSSDKERQWNWILEPPKPQNNQKTETKAKVGISKKVTNSYFWWKKIGLICSIEPLVMYIPSRSLNGIGMNGIEESKNQGLSNFDNLQIFVMKTAHLILHSANFSADQFFDKNFNISSIHQQSNNFPWTLSLTDFHCYTLTNTNNSRKQLNLLKMELLNATIDATIKQNVYSPESSLHSLGLCIYVDTSPITISCSESQVKQISEILLETSKIMNIHTNHSPKNRPWEEQMDTLLVGKPQAPQSPQILCTEETDTTSTASNSKNESDNDDNLMVMTAWIQWTITKVSVKLYTFHQITQVERKMVMELEDIITSLDWQPVYIQLKNKVTTATVLHYVRSVRTRNDPWSLGEFSGIIMCLGEQDDLMKAIEADDFLTVTVTRAKSNNVYNKWSSYHKHHKMDKDHYSYIDDNFLSSYITELVIKLQVVEVILPIDILKRYVDIFTTKIPKDSITVQSTNLSNSSRHVLPLIYADFKGVTLVFPTLTKRNELQHDTMVVRAESINMNPHAENPICRVILRSDIYEHAAQTNILNTPGSAVEDRQYEMKINEVLVYSTSWIHRQVNLTKRNAQASLYTMNENPALEWNNMIDTSDSGEAQCLSLTSVFNICCIVAPPIIYKSETIVCGKAVEITCLTDIEVTVNLEQIRLVNMLLGQVCECLEASDDVEEHKPEEMSIHTVDDRTQRQQVVHLPKDVAVERNVDQRECGQDSGVDVDMSTTDAGCHLPSRESTEPMLIPFEYIMNFGKISIIIYENSIVKSTSNIPKICPLIHLLVNQPNTYISQQNSTRIFQVNCFDLSLSYPEEKKLMETIPSAANFRIKAIESKNGEPHPSTGIPPSFMIIKYQTGVNTKFINIEMGRPTRLNLSLPLIDRLHLIKMKLSNCFKDSRMNADGVEPPEYSSGISTEENAILNLPNLTIATKQIVLAIKLDVTSELITSMSSLSLETTSRAKRITGNIDLSSGMITTYAYGKYRALLNPMFCHLTVSISWESWHDILRVPQTRIQVYSNHIYIDIGPEQLKVLKHLQSTIDTLSKSFLKSSEFDGRKCQRYLNATAEQHYQDDLKVGAFQFIDGTADEIPLPYQVLFFKGPHQAMVWRYPQPRILTKLHINSVLPSMIDDTEIDFENVLCVIEFWSESLSSYQRYSEFPLLEIRKSTFKLPNKFPTRAVACIWKLTLYSAELDSRILAGYLRIDSYFNSSLIPEMEVTVNVKAIDLSFYNHIDTSVYRNLSAPLDHYKLNTIIPDTQCFATIKKRNVLCVLNHWEESMLLDLSGSLSIEIMDYAYLKMQTFLDEISGKIQISKCDHTNVVMILQEVSLKFGPEISHTLTLSFNSWRTALQNEEKIMENNRVILSRIVVANNCNVPVRFGQSQSTDDILLQPDECHFYTWCHNENQSMRIAITHSGWAWSKAFSTRTDGIRRIVFEKSLNSGIHVQIKSLSPTQKLLTFWGQLIIHNSLMEDFELRLLKYDTSSTAKKIVSEDGSYNLISTKPLSMIIDEKNHFAIRLRFLKSVNSWTGDIPLHANAKCDQPWLVKVPHQGKDKFLSIWVRIVQELTDTRRILVILSPLYMVRSFLPYDVTVKVDTPTLSSSFDTKIRGCGEIQQLNCPGTFENYHQLSFHNTHEISTLQPSISVSYNCVDQSSFFKKQREDIDQIMQNIFSNVKSSWPLKDDEDKVWTPVRQGKTHAFIRYQDAGLVSSTLLVEIRPWCFVMNSSGRSIAIISNDDRLTEIPHLGIVAPPKLDGIFHLQIEIEDELYASTPLQLANSEWNRGFIMPQISGLIPMDGTIKVNIDCQKEGVYQLVINSSMQEEIRIIRVMSSHVFCNFTKHHLEVATLSVSLSSTGIDLPDNLKFFGTTPCESKRDGMPICQWYPITAAANNSPKTTEVPFILLNAGFGWSCPSKVEPGISRNCIAVPFETTSIPLVITTQKDKDIIYVVACYDEHPQFIVTNNCPFDLIIRQVNPAKGNTELDAPPFSWICQVPSGKLRHYTTANEGRLIPDAASVRATKCALHLSSKEKDWFKIIDFPGEKPMRFDQYVQMDSHRDLKIIVESRGHTIYMNVEPKSEIEVSVRDIRSRLVLEGVASRSIQEIKTPCPAQSTEIMEGPSMTLTDDGSNNDTLETAENNEEKFLTCYIKGINLVISLDTVESNQRIEVASFYLLHTIVNITSTMKCLNFEVMIGDLQFDNQMFNQGGFDFPVVLISQKPLVKNDKIFNVTSSLENCIAELRKNSLFSVECLWERVDDKKGCKSVHVRILPINIYIEDKYVTQLLDYATSMMRPCCVMSAEPKTVTYVNGTVKVPTNVIIDAEIMSSPLRIHNLMIEPISILLSVHTSVRLYVALDHSPLSFGIFERQNLFTTPYRLGNALTMHYLSGAIFGAGWVVGSLEILGSPGSFAQALGSGLKDFIALPFQGLLQGPWGFIVGITHGSASLMKNITAGTVNSVTKLASSVARNLDRLTLDEEHLQRQEESRRTRPQGMAQGLYQGLTGFGISILAAVAGLAHHPLQNLLNGETSAKTLMTGVGLGLVGVVTKPLSGAAELVALTGQGLLQRTGWNSLPSARRQSVTEHFPVNSFCTRYVWKLASLMLKHCDNILYLTDADFVDNKGNKCEVTIIITRHDLLIVNRVEDKVYKLLSLRELDFCEDFGDERSLRLNYSLGQQQKYQSNTPSEHLEMDQEMRSRVEQYVISNSALVCLGESEKNVEQGTYSPSYPVNSLNFYLDPSNRNHVRALIRIVKRQSQGIDFTVL